MAGSPPNPAAQPKTQYHLLDLLLVTTVVAYRLGMGMALVERQATAVLYFAGWMVVEGLLAIIFAAIGSLVSRWKWRSPTAVLSIQQAIPFTLFSVVVIGGEMFIGGGSLLTAASLVGLFSLGPFNWFGLRGAFPEMHPWVEPLVLIGGMALPMVLMMLVTLWRRNVATAWISAYGVVLWFAHGLGGLMIRIVESIP